MSIIIKGMEMPKNCAECFFHKVFPATGVGINQLYCALCGINIVKLSDAQPDCPLVPIPPHYDLIDHNALKIAVMNCDYETRVDFLKHTMDCINKAPVVIPSDMPTYEEEGEA